MTDEQIDAVTRSFLAATVSCARCHDHKFDPVPTADYYTLAGIFRSTDLCAGVRMPRERQEPAHAPGAGQPRMTVDVHVRAR